MLRQRCFIDIAITLRQMPNIGGIDMYVYADNAATTKISQKALEAYIQVSNETPGNPSSLHTTGQYAKEALEDARDRLAKILNAKMSREIYFTSGGSEADNQAILSAAAIGERKGKKHIISSTIEHHAVLHVLDKLKKQGFEITLIPVAKNGIVNPEDVKAAITDQTCLVTIMMANNEIGTIQDVAAIGAICKEKGVIFHTDAVQAVGHLPIDVQVMNIDMLSLSAHKFHGPKGVGALYSSIKVPLINLVEGGAQERGKRAGTENLPGIVSMIVALEDAYDNLEEKTKIVTALCDQLIAGLTQVPHSILNGDAINRLPGNVSVCFEGIEGEALLLRLDMAGICGSSGSACTSGSLDPSHVLLALGYKHEIAHGSLRLSITEENTPEEMEYMIAETAKVVEYLRSMSPVWEALETGATPHLI